nr:death-associated protein 1 isoform X2 [Caretta caretta]
MSSPDQERAETRAGHPPAVKAGGMRIVQKHPHTPDAKEEKDKDDQEWESSSPPKPTVFISGVIARETEHNEPVKLRPCLHVQLRHCSASGEDAMCRCERALPST